MNKGKITPLRVTLGTTLISRVGELYLPIGAEVDMDRLVQAIPRGAKAFSGNGTQDVKDYLNRVARYVPAEILAAYLTLLPIVIGTTRTQAALRIGLLAVILFGLGLINIPYLLRMAPADKPKRKHIIVSTLAYLAWTYSIGGFWTTLGLYHEAVAAILIVFVSLGSGLVIPYEGEA
jgi:hypothetical protein